MHLHILGICGTFMGGIAALAQSEGHRVTGSDSGVYPPMSDQLAALGIEVWEGHDPAQLEPAPDCVVIGNVMSRGNPLVEWVLNRGLNYTSGPQWLAEHVLRKRWVLAVAGTHGKTSTAGMLAWILEYAGLAPGFLIGGVPRNFDCSARQPGSDFFVVEADEYDTAFFDKRSKFVHYRPRTLVMGNLEFDHADIFPDIDAIRTQFHHLVRTVPGEGLIVHNAADANLRAVLEQGCWTATESFSADAGIDADWQAASPEKGGLAFGIVQGGRQLARLEWAHGGLHNVCNALAAIAAARHAGVPVPESAAALASYAGVRRRMELLADQGGIRIYDDFAHHPTAIASTLRGMRAEDDKSRIVAVIEPRSNTMKMGVHAALLADALAVADRVMVYRPPGINWDIAATLAALGEKLTVHGDTGSIVEQAASELDAPDRVVIMSNGGFEGLHGRLVAALASRDGGGA